MTSQTRNLYRSRSNRMVAGVCGGLGEYLGIDPTIVRLAFAIGLFFGHAFVLILYLIMLIVVPEEPPVVQTINPPAAEPARPDEPGAAQ